MQNYELTKDLKGLNLYIIGIMGSGKSTVGKPLSKILNYKLVDTDKMIEQTAKSNISKIFRENGEAYFRHLEQQVLTEISSYHSLVVATGGGIVTNSINWGIMRQGIIIWLDLSPTIILKRLSLDKTERPLLLTQNPAKTLQNLMNNRRELYAEADLHILPGDKTPEEIAEQIAEALPCIIRSNNSVKIPKNGQDTD